MKKATLLLTFIVIIFGNTIAQSESEDLRMKVVHDFIAAYNAKDFKKAKKDFPFLVRVLIPKKILAQQFAPMYEKLGVAKIDTVTYSNKYHYRAQLSFDKDSTAREFLSFLFDSDGTLNGVGSSEPSFIYPKSITANHYSTEDLEEKIASIVKKNHLEDSTSFFNGSILVADQGKTVFKGSYGYTDFDKQTSINEHSRFDLASCSKQFTAMGIMILQEQGKLKYSDDVTQYIPKLPYQGITIEDLLHHTSGLPSYMALVDKEWDKSKFLTNYDIVDLLHEHQPKVVFEAGKSFRYSNTGYVMLAVVIEQASGMSFAEFMKQNVFQPLGMNDTRVYNTKRSKGEVIGNFAHGYVKDRKTREFVMADSSERHDFVRYMDNIVGDGAICSSIHDLAIWGNSTLNQELVSAANWEKARTKLVLDDGRELGYGFGVFLRQDEGMEEVIYHTGGWPGYVTIIVQLPEIEKTIAILSNNDYNDVLNMADEILYNVFFSEAK